MPRGKLQPAGKCFVTWIEIQIKKYKIQITNYKLQKIKNKLQKIKNKIQNTKYKIQQVFMAGLFSHRAQVQCLEQGQRRLARGELLNFFLIFIL